MVTVPLGFTTDLASIPTAVERLTVWRPFEGPQRWAGTVHDWLYVEDRIWGNPAYPLHA